MQYPVYKVSSLLHARPPYTYVIVTQQNPLNPTVQKRGLRYACTTDQVYTSLIHYISHQVSSAC